MSAPGRPAATADSPPRPAPTLARRAVAFAALPPRLQRFLLIIATATLAPSPAPDAAPAADGQRIDAA